MHIPSTFRASGLALARVVCMAVTVAFKTPYRAQDIGSYCTCLIPKNTFSGNLSREKVKTTEVCAGILRLGFPKEVRENRKSPDHGRAGQGPSKQSPLVVLGRIWQVTDWRVISTVAEMAGTGRSKATTSEEDERIVEYVREHPFSNAKETRNAVGVNVSPQTVRRWLRLAGLRARRAAVKEILTDFHKAARLDFARRYVAFWRRVVFSDEKTFSSSFNGPVTVYRSNNTRFHPHYVMQRGRSGRFSINTWGWVCAEGPGALWKIEGNLDGAQYVSILENVMLPSVKILFFEDFVFQQNLTEKEIEVFLLSDSEAEINPSESSDGESEDECPSEDEACGPNGQSPHWEQKYSLLRQTEWIPERRCPLHTKRFIFWDNIT
ncbi:hypothetical protein J437_LFUL015783 [Ladona fulva]|uniref:Transposase Tc1-like domain-containing protein n=1 Tax=Ladona fulva TaxID=123851 RepID=A0A8K0P8H0_LADFU|nr:hypothetical protein J437_LFUL015783 [Ladona fulva]